jgi:hypothetical protein
MPRKCELVHSRRSFQNGARPRAGRMGKRSAPIAVALGAASYFPSVSTCFFASSFIFLVVAS